MSDKPQIISVDGIVAGRDKEPYVRLLKDGEPFAQMTIAQAQKVALDILVMASRSEADAMLVRFFENELTAPKEAILAMLMEFRLFRFALDSAKAEGSHHDPDTGEIL
jgi:hypothetical protein